MFEKAASIFVTVFAGFMANIFKCTNTLICKHTKAMRSSLLASKEVIKISILSKQIFP